MHPNGVTHFHAIKLITIPPSMEHEETEVYAVPDKDFHQIREYLQRFKK